MLASLRRPRRRSGRSRELQTAGPGYRFRGDQRLADLELDLGVRGERDAAGVALVHLAVVDRGDVSLGRPDGGGPEPLAPFVEEVAQGVGALNRRLDVDDAVGGVGVQPVEAGPGGDEWALGCVLRPGSGDPDGGRDLARRAVHQDGQVRVDVKDGLLAGLAADAVDALAGGARGRASQRGGAGHRSALRAGGAGRWGRPERGPRAEAGELQPPRARAAAPAGPPPEAPARG